MTEQFGPPVPPIPHDTKLGSSKPSQQAVETNWPSLTKVNAFYYPNWRVYRGETPGKLDYNYVNHVFYAFANLSPNGVIYLSDEDADLRISCDGVHGCLASFAKLKQQYTYLKLILSIGGGGRSENFPIAAANASTRDNFGRSAWGIINKYGFDGIDIDWEHPADRQQGEHFIALLAAVRDHMPSPYLLTTALPAAEWALRHIDFSRARYFLDLINLMAYDFTNDSRAGHHAQLYPGRAGEESGSSGVTYLISQGVPASKIVLGVPCYGRSFLGAAAPGDACSEVGGDQGTFEFKDLPRWNTAERVDHRVVSAFCIGGDGGFVSYDNPETVKIKGNYCKTHGLAGLFYWTGTADGIGNRSLKSAGFRALHSV